MVIKDRDSEEIMNLIKKFVFPFVPPLGGIFFLEKLPEGEVFLLTQFSLFLSLGDGQNRHNSAHA